MATVKGHKKYLGSLEETDPEFFAFLKENDSELLDFDDSGEDEDSEDEEDQLHKPPEELEVASDSEAEEEQVDEESEDHKKILEKTLKKRVINLHVIAHWETRLASTKELGVLADVMEGLESAVDSCLLDKEGAPQKWKIEGSTNFNALVRLCIRNIKSFCVRFLCASNNATLAETMFDSKPFDIRDKYKQRWAKLRPKIKTYMTILTTFLKSMGNAEAIASVLRHCQKMSGFWVLMGSKSFKFTKVLVNLWSQGEDSCRVLSFLTLMRMANYSKEVFLERFMKQMYMSYVSNSKFTSVNSWPAINFMRHCLVELYLVDTSSSYYIAFPFIRQLAIHLRNAVTAGTGNDSSNTKTSKVEASRIVYSWQFLHSIHLWVDLLAESATDDNMKLLVHPLVQVCLGTLKLIPSKKFIPLRFHIARMMTKLQEKTKTFIPVLPIIIEALLLTDFSAKSVQKFSVRPLDFSVCLKADPSEGGYLRALSENAFECILRACAAVATELSFPEIVTPPLTNIKKFLKKQCKNPEVSKKFKALVDKVEENIKFVNSFREKALEAGQVSLSDPKKIQILRVQMETSTPSAPLLAFAADYLKLNKREQAKLRRKDIETREEKLIPKMSKKQAFRKKKLAESTGPMFGSDDEDEDNDDDDEDQEYSTKLDQEDVEVEEEEEDETPKKKKKKMANGQAAGKTVANGEAAGKKTANGEAAGKKLTKKGKEKKAKLVHANDEDELVDLDLSD